MDILSKWFNDALRNQADCWTVGGPDRPPSQRMIAQARADEQQRRMEERNSGVATSSSGTEQDEGYWAYMQRQLNERTERLGIMGDSMDNLERSSAGWAEDVGKFVQKQKRNMVMGGMHLALNVLLIFTDLFQP